MSEARKVLAKPPFNILLNPTSMGRQKPWDLDLTFLLDSFLKFLVESGRVDLRVAGTAALSSAIIYRLKVETFFVLERAKIIRYQSSLEEPEQLLDFPFRYELPSTTIDELLIALERVLQDIIAESRRSQPSILEQEPPPKYEGDPFEANIKSSLADFKSSILARLSEAGRLIFRELAAGQTLIDAARTFILLLFLAQEGSVDLIQEEDEIVVLRTTPNAGGP